MWSSSSHLHEWQINGISNCRESRNSPICHLFPVYIATNSWYLMSKYPSASASRIISSTSSSVRSSPRFVIMIRRRTYVVSVIQSSPLQSPCLFFFIFLAIKKLFKIDGSVSFLKFSLSCLIFTVSIDFQYHFLQFQLRGVLTQWRHYGSQLFGCDGLFTNSSSLSTRLHESFFEF